MFSRVKSMSKGYDPAEVDAFLKAAKSAYESDVDSLSPSDVFTKVFPQIRGGYDCAEVDVTLDRLAAAVIKKRRADFVQVNGQQAWLDQIAERATTLYPRLMRPDGERFSRPSGGRAGYSVSEVDAFLKRVSQFFDESGDLSANEVRNVSFSPKFGKKAYDERVVDAYLNRLLEVLLAVE